jgi:hypothetical protein
MLAHLVTYAGVHLVHHEKQLSSILNVGLASEEAKVYKASHKLLRAVSFCLCVCVVWKS